MKKTICFMLSAMLSVSGTISIYGASFADANKIPWAGASSYINEAVGNGLMVGSEVNGQKVFRATEDVTLCETAQLVYNLLKQTGNLRNTSGIEEKWMSVMKGYQIPSWAYTGVSYCLENSIIAAGDVVAFMSGNSSVGARREQVAYMFGRALQTVDGSLNGGTGQSFKDANKISAAAVPYVNLLYQKGILSGDTDGNFNPKQNINRAEMAVLITKAYQVIEDINLQSKGSVQTQSYTATTTSIPGSTPASAQSDIGIVTGLVYEVQSNGDNLFIVLNNSGRVGYMGSGTMSISYMDGGTGILGDVRAGDSVSITYEGSRIVRLVLNESKPTIQEKESKTSGTIATISTRKIRLSGGNYLDIIDKVLVKMDGSNNKDLDDVIDAVDDGDEVYADLTLNENNEVMRIVARTEDDDDDDDDDRTKDKKTGLIRKISTRAITIRSTSYDLADEEDLDISVSDGKNTKISDIDDLIAAVEDDKKEIEATIKLDSHDEVIKITGDVTQVEGMLHKVMVNSDKVEIECDSEDRYTYPCDSDVEIRIDGETVKNLDKLYDIHDRDDIEVTLNLDDGYVEEIIGKIK